jgi:ribonucleotide monophosphatase NagD (HAD superfamily)
MLEPVSALLIDLDGVLYVEEDPVEGAVDAVARLRERPFALRFVANTTAQSRARTLDKLSRVGFAVSDPELITPAGLAIRYCRNRDYGRVALVMNDEVKRDFADLEETVAGAQAVIVGDLGPAFGYDVLNQAFRRDGRGGADRPAEEPLLVAR